MKDITELTTHCIRCGFCLEACPTFLTTASELESPRGRIYLVRSALEGKLNWQEDVRPHLDLCLGCRACETACPSGVEYGAILEMARDITETASPSLAKSALLTTTTSPALLRANLALGGLLPGSKVPWIISRLVSGKAAEAEKPTAQVPAQFPPLDDETLPRLRGEVYLLEGCAMRVLYPRVHQATRRLLRRVGYAVREVPQGCCGALHAHNGHLQDAATMAESLVRAMPEDLPVVVNSAGCGSTMKEYESLIGDGQFAARVADLSEFLLRAGLAEVLRESPGLATTVTYHDACHLSHGQRIWEAPRALIQSIPQVRYQELNEADMCCGSAGIYNVVQPEMARNLLERKWSNIEASSATVVASGNPGCHSWIAQASREHGRRVQVLHTAELLEASFVGLSLFS